MAEGNDGTNLDSSDTSDHWSNDFEGLSDEDRSAVEKYETVEAAIVGGVEAQRTIGKMVKIPDDDASDEDKAKFTERIAKYRGVPEKAEGYELTRPKMPEGVLYNEEGELALRNIAKTHNMSQAAVAAVYDLYCKTTLAAHGVNDAANKKAREEGEATLRSQEVWGAQADENFELVKRLGSDETLGGGEELGKWLNETRMGDNVPLMKFMATVAGLLVKEGHTIRGAAASKHAAGALDYPSMDEDK